MRTPLVLNLLGLLLAASSAVAEPATLRVDPEGRSGFRTIQSAVDAIPADSRQRVIIEIADGLYNEKVRIDADRVTLRGQSRTGTRIAYDAPRSEYDRRYDRVGPAVLNVFGTDLVVENLTVENTQTSREHAFAIYGQPDRFILRGCDVLSEGGDTVSLWNTPYGRYYHTGCRFRGGVDFVCPRGWCYVRDCDFECPTTSAAIWHDGHMDPSMKFVLRDCRFDGVADFWIGRNHYPSQFYLLGCRFSRRLADRPIEVVSDPRPGVEPALYQRKYFHDCHREDGDYAWMADNLHTAEGAPEADAIDAAWTFDGEWDPESDEPPRVVSVEVGGDEVHVYFTEAVAGAEAAAVLRADGSRADYARGDGTRRLVYTGGNSGSAPERLQHAGAERVYGTVATLAPRRVDDLALPRAAPRRIYSVVLVGDSTVASYPPSHAYQGWGAALSTLFDDRVRVVNHARGGRSSKSFRDEGRWEAALGQSPDFVLIQFGHNDNPGKGPERETDPGPGGSYRANLHRYVAEARAAGAVPVLVTPTTRRTYTEAGQGVPDAGNTPYADAVRSVAEELGVGLVDLNQATVELFDRMGESHSEWMQPQGDRTHFTPAGARRVASLVAERLATAAPELAPMVLPDALRERR